MENQKYNATGDRRIKGQKTKATGKRNQFLSARLHVLVDRFDEVWFYQNNTQKGEIG